jgi:hypothetical protein
VDVKTTPVERRLDVATPQPSASGRTAPVGRARLSIIVLLAPVLWVGAGVAAYLIAALTCDQLPREIARGAGAPRIDAVLQLAALAIASAGLAAAWRTVRRLRRNQQPDSVQSRVWSRSRFLAIAGTIASAVLVFGIALFVLGALAPDSCRQIR